MVHYGHVATDGGVIPFPCPDCTKTRCAYCGADATLTDQADLPYPEVGPCCSDECSITRRHNTAEFGGVP